MRNSAFCICENKLRGVIAAYFNIYIYIVQPPIVMKFQASSQLLWLYSPACVELGRNTEDMVSHNATQMIGLVCLMLYVPANNFSVVLGRSHHFLGITSTFWGKYVLFKNATRQPEWGSNPRTLESEVLTTRPPRPHQMIGTSSLKRCLVHVAVIILTSASANRKHLFHCRISTNDQYFHH